MDVITVTSGQQNPADFISNFSNSIQLSENYEIALLKMAHPPLTNITDENNKLYLINSKSDETEVLTISTGYYKSTHDIAVEIFHQISKEAANEAGPFGLGHLVDEFDTHVTIKYKNVGSTDEISITFSDKNIKFSADHSNSDNILFFLNIKLDSYTARTINIKNYDLRSNDKIGFIYSSIVSNSLIDSHQSRILDTVPLITDDGYSFYEVINPVFHNMSVASFIDIEFQIRSVNGNLIKFAKILPTILTLAIRRKS